jgi:MFS superfamily sulfate permease-like transporter
MAVVLAGLLQIGMGILRAGFIGYFFPSSAIKGMLSGIGLIIILKQLPHAVGYDQVHEGSFAFLQEDGQNTLSELLHMLGFISPGPLLIALASLTILIVWEQDWLKKIPVISRLPAPLLAVSLGAGLVSLFQNVPSLSLESSQVVTVPVLTSWDEVAQLVTFPDFTAISRSDVWITALTIAIVASIETLLCVEATDKLDPYKRVTPPNRELVAQGIGNTLAGLIGGLPLTQVIVRSSSNILAEGRTKTSAIFHGLWLLLSVLLFPQIMNMIPLASLAAILLLVGYKLAKPAVAKELYQQGPEHFIPYAITILGLLFTDLLIGVGMGLAAGLIAILWENYRNPFYADEESGPEEKRVRIQLSEDVSFLNKAGLMRRLDSFPTGTHVYLDASRTRKMHPDVEEVIEAFLVNAETRDIDVEYVRTQKTPVGAASEETP